MEFAIENEIDSFTLAMDVIRRVPKLQQIGSADLERFRNTQIACRNYAYQHGTDSIDIADWKWSHEIRKAAS